MSEEEMDNFVFAVMPKKTANKMQRELQDLVRGFGEKCPTSSVFNDQNMSCSGGSAT